jgi:peptidoglycan/LPS O-acetylase OafA/YrhL
MVTSRPPTLSALTSSRFVAAMGVVAYHWVSLFTNNLHQRPPFPWWQRALFQGSLGVDFFFLLSGFILAYTYAVPDSGLKGTRRAFWVARLARIYPVYLLGLALDVIPYLGRSHHALGLVASGISVPLLLHAWLPFVIDAKSWNPPSWSLSVEAVFYLAFPFIVMRMARLGRNQLAWIAAASFAAFGALPLPLIVLGTLRGHAIPWWLDYIIQYNPVMRLPEFVLGVALGLLFLRQSASQSQQSVRLRARVCDLGLVAIICAVLLLALAPMHLPSSYPAGVLFVPLFASAIYLLAQPVGIVARAMSWSWMTWLGEISYGTYILHWPLWSWTSTFATRTLHMAIDSPALLIMYLAMLIAVSGLSYEYIERPARKAIRARWEHARPSSGSTSIAGVAGLVQPGTWLDASRLAGVVTRLRAFLMSGVNSPER